MSQAERILDNIEKFKFLERAARKELDVLSKQYNALLERLRICRLEIESYEQSRLALEASLKEVNRPKTKVKRAEIDIKKALFTLSEEERKALIAELSAM